MKRRSNLLCACLLFAALTATAVAGEVQNPGIAAPTPTETSIAGEVQNPGLASIMLDLVLDLIS
jgi:protein involved in polysaccharide export with SLBB domain